MYCEGCVSGTLALDRPPSDALSGPGRSGPSGPISGRLRTAQACHADTASASPRRRRASPKPRSFDGTNEGPRRATRPVRRSGPGPADGSGPRTIHAAYRSVANQSVESPARAFRPAGRSVPRRCLRRRAARCGLFSVGPSPCRRRGFLPDARPPRRRLCGRDGLGRIATDPTGRYKYVDPHGRSPEAQPRGRAQEGARRWLLTSDASIAGSC